MSLRWCSRELPPVNRDSGGDPVTGAGEHRPGGRPGRAIGEALAIAGLIAALLVVVWLATHP